ncbi:MAG: hypothetical protein AB2L14_02750 [Candidatus Xenobiia bacterium LiM19]
MSDDEGGVGAIGSVTSQGGSVNEISSSGLGAGARETTAPAAPAAAEPPAKIDESDKVSIAGDEKDDVKDPDKADDTEKTGDPDKDKEISDLKDQIDELKKKIGDSGKTDEAGKGKGGGGG